MRIDPVVALTLMLFSIIVAATSVSVSWGYALGRSALRGVTQPDVRPSSLASYPSASSSPRAEAANTSNGTTDIKAETDMVFWSEAVIIDEVKAKVND
ncbi:MAG: hypothetical protein F6K30_02910 [Cyanothece sp. SIO2G6]|nr:hypothetical protein [Cyanothece sp. SIO2G6]